MASGLGPVTTGAALQEGADLLRGVTDEARLEAELLLAYALGLPRAALLTHPERPISAEQQRAYQALLTRRIAHYPLPYLLRRVEFCGLEFVVTPDVLIPRPETEMLVELALRYPAMTALDVGTGSGCIAVSLAVRNPALSLVATDLSIAALRLAMVNARRNGVGHRVRWVCGDLTRPLRGPVDLVVANLPYVAQDEWATLPPSVREHEPRLALDGGPDGLGLVRRLLSDAPRLLRPGGALLLEIGATQGRRAVALARSLCAGARVALHLDLAGRDRVVVVEFGEG